MPSSGDRNDEMEISSTRRESPEDEEALLLPGFRRLKGEALRKRARLERGGMSRCDTASVSSRERSPATGHERLCVARSCV